MPSHGAVRSTRQYRRTRRTKASSLCSSVKWISPASTLSTCARNGREGRRRAPDGGKVVTVSCPMKGISPGRGDPRRPLTGDKCRARRRIPIFPRARRSPGEGLRSAFTPGSRTLRRQLERVYLEAGASSPWPSRRPPGEGLSLFRRC